MSVFEGVCAQDGCIQCWAEVVIATSDADIEAEIERQLRAEPALVMDGLPPADELATARRSGRREARLVARLVLHEPHECGRPRGGA